MFVPVVELRAMEEADCVGDADGVEVVGGRVAEGVADDFAELVARGGGVVDGLEGVAVEVAVGGEDVSVVSDGGHGCHSVSAVGAKLKAFDRDSSGE